MSAPGTPAPPTRRSLAWRIVRGVLIASALSLLILFLSAGYESLLVDFGRALLLGWWFFLARTGQAIHFNWDLWGMAALCAVLFVAGTQRFLAWLSQTVAHHRGATWVWPWRWTWCGSAALAVLFAVGMSIGGIVHQVGWLASSPGPFLVPDNYWTERSQMLQLDHALRRILQEKDATVASLRAEAAADPSFSGHSDNLSCEKRSLLVSYQILLILEADGQVTGAIILPRDMKLRALVGGDYFSGETAEGSVLVPPADLARLVEQHQARLVAL